MPDGPQLWGGRFAQAPSEALKAFTYSVQYDRRLYREDIAGSIAHVEMLGEAGIITSDESASLVAGLLAVRDEMDSGTFVFDAGDEDIHSAIERRLHQTVGPEVAGKLHTGRSRNDQVALDMRLYALRASADVASALTRLQGVLLDLARTHADAVMPAYTHMQRAQPTTLGHHLLAHFAMLQRDFGRILDARRRTAVMPLGSGAATGSGLPLRRHVVAARLGMETLTDNSLDAVSDRDFLAELEFACALVLVHLSRLAEELVLWSTAEFGFLTLSDDFTTGSSLMPQKKNPDVAELVRGRSGRVIGDLLALLVTLKGLPLSYNRDLQEDKEGFFHSVDTTSECLEVTAAMLARAVFNTDRMSAAAGDPGLMATEVADQLVRRGVPFRRSHELVGRAVRLAGERGTTLAGLELGDWVSIDPAFGQWVLGLFDPAAALASRDIPGSPGPGPLLASLETASTLLAANLAAIQDATPAG